MRLPSLWRREPLFRGWLTDDFEKLFEEFLGRHRLPAAAGETATVDFMPAIDVVEREGEFLVKAELPGIDAKDIDITVVGEALRIRGEKKFEKEEKKENYYATERSYGSFLRTIPLGVEVDADKIEAKLVKGVLEVTIPKVAAAKAKKIEITGEEKVEPIAKPMDAARPREAPAGVKR